MGGSLRNSKSGGYHCSKAVSSQLLLPLWSLLGIRKTRTTPLHPQSDRMVALNRTLEQHLSKVVDENQTDWDQRIPLFLMAYRSSVHNTIGMTSAKLVFGQEICLPGDLMLSLIHI